MKSSIAGDGSGTRVASTETLSIPWTIEPLCWSVQSGTGNSPGLNRYCEDTVSMGIWARRHDDNSRGRAERRRHCCDHVCSDTVFDGWDGAVQAGPPMTSPDGQSCSRHRDRSPHSAFWLRFARATKLGWRPLPIQSMLSRSGKAAVTRSTLAGKFNENSALRPCSRRAARIASLVAK